MRRLDRTGNKNMEVSQQTDTLPDNGAMSPVERRAAVSLAGIYALRMLGLFMILPVLALYGRDLEGATPFLIGLAVGIYGLTQGLLQIPFGMLSDSFGRKPLIIIGLLLFAAGSLVAASAETMWAMIIGRALQGSGAVAAVLMALLADLTREEQRTKAMAMFGASIGASFILALMLGPLLAPVIGLAGIFWLTALLSLLAIWLVVYYVPTPVANRTSRETRTAVPTQILSVLSDPQLWRLDASIFILHANMTAFFVVIPLALEQAGWAASSHWKIYLPVLLLSVVGMVPLMLLAEKRQKTRWALLGSVMTLMLMQLFLGTWYTEPMGLFVLLVGYFIAFNLLEANFPSLISRMAPADKKGTALGVYATAQFIGVFVGGALGGWVYGRYGISVVLWGCSGLSFIWLFWLWSVKIPPSKRYSNSTQAVNKGEPDVQRG